ncbi:MAG: recombinase family protein [Syntrophales bacterium LBB04]|nr:recombinase family protein [Syntrophales bacterium LBB04]
MPPRKPPKDGSFPPKMKAYGYCRVSTEEQAREGISLDAQEDKIRTYAQLKDLELLDIIRDEGYSGKNIQRPGLQKLLALIQGPEAEAVIVYKLDRLTRNTSDLLHLVEVIFRKDNTRFFSITEEIDTDSAMGKFFLTIMGAMAQMERELISERTVAALSYKKQQGESLGHIPYGYHRVSGRLLPDPQEGQILRKMKKWRKDGLSYGKIAQLLNEKKIPTKKQNALWYASTVRHLLTKKKK